MLEVAEQFYRAAERCGGMLSEEWLPHPQVVNYAFAAEVALKGLRLVHRGDSGRGHDLAIILGDLPADVQDRVRGSAMAPALFVDRLRNVGKAFEVWRYSYERGQTSISVKFLEDVANSTIAVLQQDIAATP